MFSSVLILYEFALYEYEKKTQKKSDNNLSKQGKAANC